MTSLRRIEWVIATYDEFINEGFRQYYRQNIKSKLRIDLPKEQLSQILEKLM